jgi:hypothetical protein
MAPSHRTHSDGLHFSKDLLKFALTCAFGPFLCFFAAQTPRDDAVPEELVTHDRGEPQKARLPARTCPHAQRSSPVLKRSIDICLFAFGPVFCDSLLRSHATTPCRRRNLSPTLKASPRRSGSLPAGLPKSTPTAPNLERSGNKAPARTRSDGLQF